MAKQILSVPEVLAEQRMWDDRYLGAVIHSIELSDNGADEKDALIEQFLSRDSRDQFRATNPYSKSVFLPHLIEQFLQRLDTQERRSGGHDKYDYRGADKTVFVMVTFTDKRWATNNQVMKFDLQAAKMKVRNALGGTDFICHFEAAHYVNVDYEHLGVTGKLVLFHCHALVWASSLSKLKRIREGMRHRFTPPEGAKASMQVKKVPASNVPKVLGYISKMPTLGYLVHEYGGMRTQRKAALRPNAHYKYFKAMTEYSMFDFWLASGHGAEALRKARTAAQAEVAQGPRVWKVRRGRPLLTLGASKREPRYRWGA